MSYDWKNIYKKEAQQRLERAGISENSEFGKLFMRFSRRINTCWNLIDKGCSWETVTSSQASDDAREILESFNGEGHRYETPKYWNEWLRLCEANGIDKDATVGDHLC